MEKVTIEIAEEEKELRKKHWDELIVTKWGRAVLERDMRERHAQELEEFAKKAVEERFAARTSVLVMQKLELELKQRDAEMRERHKSEWAATPWGAPPDPNAEAPPPTHAGKFGLVAAPLLRSGGAAFCCLRDSP